MRWNDVGDWIKDNAGTGASLVGSLLTGNVAGAISAGVAFVSGATGTNDPAKALEVLKSDPETLIKLKELAFKNEESIRQHIEAMTLTEMQDKQAEQKEQQSTIRQGDKASDEYVRRTRPLMARQSWYGTMAYIMGAELLKFYGYGSGAVMELSMVLIAPASAYMGFRTYDKHSVNKHK